MKAVIQRVQHASVTINNNKEGSIEHGFLIFLGVGHNDNEEIADKLVKKILNLRIFEDSEGKSNLSLLDVEGELLVVSQFTLMADCRKGNRPSFIDAAKPEMANKLYDYFIKKCKEQVTKVQTGEFGADMKVELLNDGPFTIVLDME